MMREHVWFERSDGSVIKMGSTHSGGKVCMIDGERAAHSHYMWAKDRFWAACGDRDI